MASKHNCTAKRACVHCGTKYLPRAENQKYCKNCQRPNHGGFRFAKMGKPNTSQTYGPFHCPVCAKEFYAKRKNRITCSRECHNKVRAQQAEARRRVPRLIKAERSTYRAWARRARERAKERAKLERMSRLDHVRTCRKCHSKYRPNHEHQKYCSQSCGDKAQRNANKAKRRARMAGARVQHVDPIAVFERDGWRCQLCGGSTHRGKRGTSHPKAPELDHIIPLARGGEHSYVNTQCTCRACNHAKSDTELGQLRLFAGIQRQKDPAPPPIG